MPNTELLDTLQSNWIYKNYKTILIHLGLWLFYYVIDFSFVIAIRGSNQDLFEYSANVLFMTSYFYIAIYLLYNPKSTQSLVFSALILVAILFSSLAAKCVYDVYLLKIPIAIETFQKNKFSYFGLELWRLTTCTFYAIAYLTYLRSLQDQKIIQETERKLLLTEIAFLKAQINPHFLFNTLNFVFEDVSTISPKSGDTILKLAEMMRYSVQSTKLDFAPVINEAEAIDRYIYLQRKRFGERMYVDFHKQGNLSKKEIPPLIMLSLVENAFKYGVFYDAENPIEIFLEVTESEIVFSCKNKIRDNFKETETNAVGITNIRRRLEISYKNNFELENWIDNKNYFVHLRVFSKKMSLSLN